MDPSTTTPKFLPRWLVGLTPGRFTCRSFIPDKLTSRSLPGAPPPVPHREKLSGSGTSHCHRQQIRLVIAISAILHFIAAAWLPISQDEAYYLNWARYPDLGYFDHPPLIAWMMIPGTWTENIFWARFLPICLALATYPLFMRIMTYLNWDAIKDSRIRLTAVILFSFNLFGTLFGVLATPDVPMLICWLAATHEACAALNQPKRWITTGLLVGTGMMGKYTMVLFVIGLIVVACRYRSFWRQPWFYAGGFAALLAFTPNLIWNQSENWISYRFQLSRGLQNDHHINGWFHSPIPPASDKVLDSQGFYLAQNWFEAKQEPRSRPPLSSFRRILSRQINYWGGQAAPWGLFWLPLGLVMLGCHKFGFRRKRTKSKTDENKIYSKMRSDSSEKLTQINTSHPNVKHLIQMQTWVPLIFFAIVSLVSKVEANWPAAYIFGACILLAPPLSRSIRWVKGAATFHILLLIAVIAIAAQREPLLALQHQRLIRETHGFDQLAADLTASQSQAPIFADTYQLSSMLTHYLAGQTVAQWPGLTRPSELTRRQEVSQGLWTKAQQSGQLILATSHLTPPWLKGFHAVSLEEVRACSDQSQPHKRRLTLSIANPKPDLSTAAICQDYYQRWFLAHYARD